MLVTDMVQKTEPLYLSAGIEKVTGSLSLWKIEIIGHITKHNSFPLHILNSSSDEAWLQQI